MQRADDLGGLFQHQPRSAAADVLDDGRFWRRRLAAKWLVLALLPVLLWLCGQGRALNLMALGEVQARQLGLSLHLWRNLLVLAIGWLVGVSVALAR